MGGLFDLVSDIFCISILILYVVSIYSNIEFNIKNLVIFIILTVCFFCYLSKFFNYSFYDHTANLEIIKIIDSNTIIISFLYTYFFIYRKQNN